MSKPLYKIVIEVNNTKYEASGSSALSAVKKIKIDFFKTTGILKATYKGKKFETLMPIVRLKRLMFNDMFQQTTSKNIELMLK